MKAEQERVFRPITVTFETANEVEQILGDLARLTSLREASGAAANLYDALSAVHRAGKANWMTPRVTTG